MSSKTVNRRKLPPTFYWKDNGTITFKHKGLTRRSFKTLEEAEIAKAHLRLQLDEDEETLSNTPFNAITADYLDHK